ncbi:MAG: protoglobin domain-containing protein, partial [Candidatus Heimdallarchaeota archaeon]|nr:protoglobin domain-containing protein [Candidatus Heimdallarchaeota archaeon]
MQGEVWFFLTDDMLAFFIISEKRPIYVYQLKVRKTIHILFMRKIDKTLAEQLQITDREISKRKHLLGFTTDDAHVLKDNKPLIDKYIDGIVMKFYEHQTAVPEIALVIGDAETLRRLQSAMRSYILELFEGHYDAGYVNRRLRIGKIHERIGVSPKLYI